MAKFNYVCLNAACDSQEERIRNYKDGSKTFSRIGKIDNFIIEKEETDDSEELCRFCNNPLKHIGFVGVQVFSGMSLMTTEQKQNMLIKRSKVHQQLPEQVDRRAEMDSKLF